MSTISPPSARVGAQEPRLRSVPLPSAPTAGDEAIALAATAGLALDPWQQLVLRDAMREGPDGRWAAFEVGLVVPRQNGKGSVLEALELAALFLPDPDAPPPLILHSAHEFKTSAEHFRRMRDLIESSAQLKSRVRIVRTAAGSEAIELHSGARLRFVTRTGGSGRGFSADLIVIDEAYNLTAESMAAVLPTMSARPNPQVWYTSSAGLNSSEQLERIRERGMSGTDPSLAYFEWSCDENADLDDPQNWLIANPALGIRIPEHFVAAERAALPEIQFARERLGVWASKEALSGAFDPAAWSALADLDADPVGSVSYGVATAPDRSWSALAAGWRRPDGAKQLVLLDYRPGTQWVAAVLAERRAAHPGRVLVDVASDGLCLGDKVSLTDQAKSQGALFDEVNAGQVRNGGEPAVATAVRESRWRALGDTRVLDRKGKADISPLVAAALAFSGVGESFDISEAVW